MDKELKARLAGASSLDEAKEILRDCEGIDAERVYAELENHRSNKSELLDLEELDAVSGGSFRDWVKDGCAATCEEGSWCWSNDRCAAFEVLYEHFWTRCPDGQPHEYNVDGKCVRCNHYDPNYHYGPHA